MEIFVLENVGCDVKNHRYIDDWKLPQVEVAQLFTDSVSPTDLEQFIAKRNRVKIRRKLQSRCQSWLASEEGSGLE